MPQARFTSAVRVGGDHIAGRLSADKIADSCFVWVSQGTQGVQTMFTDSYRCPDCGCPVPFRSRRRGILEKVLFVLLFLKPVRYSNCFRRSTTSLFTRTRRSETRSAASPRAAA